MKINDTQNSQFEVSADCVDYYLEKPDIKDVDTLILAGVAIEIDRMLNENTQAIEDVVSGRIWAFPHDGIGTVEKPSPKTLRVMSRILPILANEIFETSVRE